MQNTAFVDAKGYQRKHNRRKAWKNFVRVMACIVVFCTTYALILPAITMEKATFCGLEAHVHEEACYTQAASMVCDPTAGEDIIVLHTHDALCYQGDVLLCTLQEREGHLHTDDCYETVVTPAHTHDESCMILERGTQLCQLEEIEGHTHTDACFAPGINLQCGEEEREGHSHGEACYETQDVLNCAEGENPEHTHDETCYTQVSNLICELQEDPGHSHTDECYELVNICGLEEIEGHAHTDECFEMVEVLGCGLEENPEEIVEKNLTCTLMELAPHTHGEGCFDENGQQICTILNAVEHQHTEECIQVSQNEENLICEKEVHEHILQCYSNPEADLETAADWEATFAQAELSGVWREDVLTIAKTQLGYNESTKNYIVEEDGETMKGYTRYGAWYGIPYGDWCAMYASFCLHYAGAEGMPLDASCPKWISALSQLNLYHSEDSYVPVPGDLIFFDWNTDADADHVGLVVETDGEKVKTIEGNNGDTVTYHDYKLSDSRIMGYGALPVQVPEQEETGSWNCGMTAHTHGESCYDQDKLTCQTSEHIHDENCKNKQLYYTDDTLRAFVTIKGVEELPQDLSVRVWQISPEEDPESFAAMQTALIDQLATDTQFVKESAFYGMELLSEGAVYELPVNAEVSVRVEFAQPLFTAEAMESAAEMDTYQMISAEGSVSTFAARTEEENSPAYLTESVTNETYNDVQNGVTSLEFQANTVTTFAVALTSNVQQGTYWTRVYSTSDITSGGTYMIVSAEGSYALTGSSTTSSNYQAVKYAAVKGNTQYYTITDSSGNTINSTNLYWTISQSGSGYTIRNQGTNNYVYLDEVTTGSGRNPKKETYIVYSGSKNLTISPATKEKLMRIANGDYYLRNTGEGAFGRTNTNDGQYNEKNIYYYTRDMVIFKLSDVEELEIPNDVVKNTAGNNNQQQAPEKPNYGAFKTPSGSKTGTTAVAKNGVTVTGNYYSDPATSDLERNFRKDSYEESQKNDGKVMTDKSVIYGADDYGAFANYDANTFSVALSALGQEYAVSSEYTIKTPVDVVFVLDVSGSMEETVPNSNPEVSRAQALTDAVNASMFEILDEHEANRVGIVLYSTGAWEMLPLDRYTADNNEYLVCSKKTDITTSNGYTPQKYVVEGSSTLKNLAGKSYGGKCGRESQGVGTYTQAGIALGYKVFMDIGDDTTYTPTNAPQVGAIKRQPVFILLSDGEPTHSTNNYADVLNGPHYGDGRSNGGGNGKGIHGYNTVLSANYYKRMVGIQYDNPALFYTIGMGIAEIGDGTNNDDKTGDSYKRAVLNPTKGTIEASSSHKYKNDTIEMLESMIKGSYQNQSVVTSHEWPDSWYGVPHKNVPVAANPYTNSYSYADGAYFGQLDEEDLEEIFSEILTISGKISTYGFVLFERSAVKMTDTIGTGMEIKGLPVLRYMGKNYTNPTVTNEGNTVRYVYSGIHKDPYIPDHEADVSRIIVKVTTLANGQQQVYLEVPDAILPVYTPEMIGEKFYYEALPVRLIYQVGLTAESEQAVLNLQKTGGGLTFYTNSFTDGFEPDARTELHPNLDNPFYHGDTKQYKPHHDLKKVRNSTPDVLDNMTQTAEYSVDCTLREYKTDDNKDAIEVIHKLGNNGKLVFSVDTVDVPVEKKWTGVNADSQAPITVSLYQVTKPEGSKDYVGTLVEGKTLTLKADSDLNKNWKGMFENLPKLAEGSYYAVAEAVPSGFVAAYEKEEIKFYVDSTPVHGALVSTYDENGVAQLVMLTNSPQVTLPETGGPGTILYTTGGLLLMMAAFLLLLHNQTKKRRKEDIPSF